VSTGLLRHPRPADDWTVQFVNAKEAGWHHVSFHVLRLPKGTVFAKDQADHEHCAIVIEGDCVVRPLGGKWTEIGGRTSPFDAPPPAYYAPPRRSFEIRAETDLEVAVGAAPAADGGLARALPSSEAREEIRGSGAMERRIHHILMEEQPAASLLVTEVVTPGGHWSSYPPHKHDTDDPPRESLLEEIYYFRFKEPGAFGLMRVYTKGPRASGASAGSEQDRSLDESIAVRDRDLVFVPRGYHTFSAAPGYDAYYLNVMAGPRREWKITFDPDHERMRW
jgi:5-deoxy-glucuronate isomerase